MIWSFVLGFLGGALATGIAIVAYLLPHSEFKQ